MRLTPLISLTNSRRQPRKTVVLFAMFALISLNAILGKDEKAESDGLVKLDQYGVTFRQPKNWFVADVEKMEENVRKLDAGKEDVRAILASNRGSVVIASYSQYDPRKRDGLIPTINVLARPNPHSSFEAFRAAITDSATSMASILQDYAVTTAPTDRLLSGRRIVFFAGEYNLSIADGTYRVSSTTYAIPCGDIFLQVSTSESLPVKQKETFARFINSFSFKQP